MNKTPHINRNQGGFTLVELILYVGLMGVFIVAIASLFTSMYSVRERHARTTEVEQQGQQIMQTIGYIISGSSEIALPAAGASGAELLLNTFATNNNPTQINMIDGTLFVTKGESQPIALNNDHIHISEIAFFNKSLDNTSGSVQIIFTLTYSPDENSLSTYTSEKTFQTAFTLPR